MRRTMAVLVALGLLTGCGAEESPVGGADGNGGSGGPAGAGGSGGAEACAGGCQALASCGLCILDPLGVCLTVDECAATCRTVPTGAGVAACVSASGCDTARIQLCLGPATGGGANDCTGCYWDGSACTWCSSSDWGQGPYSGACASCDPSCCG